MFNNKKRMFLLLTLVFIAIMGVSAATAADIDNDATDAPVIADDATTQAADADIVSDVSDNSIITDVSTKNTQIIKKENTNLKSEGEGTFADLETDIAESDVTLTKDYIQGSEEKNITITEDKIIDGDGHTITTEYGLFTIESGATLTLKNSIIISPSYGTDIYHYVDVIFNKGNLILNNVTFKYDNEAKTYGATVYMTAGSTITATDSTFDGGYTNRGAIYGYGSNLVMTIDNCVFKNIKANNNPILMNSLNSNLTLTNSQFLDNSESNYGGALYFNNPNQNVFIDNCIFINNSASTRGGVMYTSAANTTVKNCIMKNNKQSGTATQYFAGCIWVNSAQVTLTLSNNTMEDNMEGYSDVYLSAGKLNTRLFVNGENVTVNQEETVTLEFAVVDDMNNAIEFSNSPFIITINDETVPSTYGNGTLKASFDASIEPGVYPIVITCDDSRITGDVTIPEFTLTVNDIGLIRYSNVTEMIANAGKVDTVVINAPVTRASTEDSIVIDKLTTIDFNGNTINAKQGKVFDITENGIVTIKNAIITNVGNSAANIYNTEGRIANVTKGIVYFENVTFVDNAAPNFGSSAYGSFILAYDDAVVELKDCYVTGCNGTFINNVNSNVLIDNTIFENNNLYQSYSINWYALIANGGRLVINNSQFINDTANQALIRSQSNTLPYSAYGSYITYSNQPLIIDNTLFKDAYARSNGAAVQTTNDTTITNSVFINGYSYNYAGAIYSYGGSLDIDSCIFINNSGYVGYSGPYHGTAIYNNAGDMNIKNSLIISNETRASAVYNNARDVEAVANYNFWGNATPEGLYGAASGATLTVDNWVIFNVTVDPADEINYKDEITVKATLNQYTDGTEVYDLADSLPEYGAVTFTSKDGIISEETVDMVDGEATTTFTVKAGEFTITAAYPNMEAVYVGQATMPEPLDITLNDGNWTTYFNDDGTINEDTVVPNSVLRFEGVFNERDMVITLPVNITTADTQAVLNNCSFEVVVDNVNITNIEMNNEDYSAYLIYLNNVANTVIENNILTITNNEDSSKTNAIIIVGGSDNTIRNNTITDNGPESAIVYDTSGNIQTVYTSAIEAVNSEGLIIDSNKITTKATTEGATYATIYGIYVKGTDKDNRISSLVITNNEIITEASAYAYGPSIYYVTNVIFDSNNVTTTSKDYACGAQFYLSDYPSVGNNIITVNSDNLGYGLLLNGYFDYASYRTTLLENGTIFNNVVDVTSKLAWGIEGYLGRYPTIAYNNVTLDADYGVGIGLADVQRANILLNNININAKMEGDSSTWDSVPVDTAGVKTVGTSLSSVNYNTIGYNNITITTASDVKSPAVNTSGNYNTISNNYLDSPYGVGDYAVLNTGSYGNTVSANTPTIRVITLNDGNWTYYFNETDGTPNPRQVIAGSELRFEGEFNERDMVINIPLNITTADEQAVFNNCTFTVTANNVNITNIEMTAEDYSSYLVLLNRTTNANIEGNTFSLTNNAEDATTHTIEVLNGSSNVIRNNTITTVSAEAGVVYDDDGNMISFPTTSIHALASNNIIIDSNKITTKTAGESSAQYGTVYGIFLRGDYNREVEIADAQVTNNEIITEADKYAYGINVDYATEANIAGNTITTTANNYADGIQVYSITESVIDANTIDVKADNYAYGVIVNGKFDWGTYDLFMAEDNTVSNNVIDLDADTVYGVEIYMGVSNTVTENNITADVAYPVGIGTSDSSYNIIQYNNIELNAKMDKEVEKSDVVDYYPAGVKVAVNPSWPMASSDENGVQYNNITITSPEGIEVPAVNVTSDSNMVYSNYLVSSLGYGNAAVNDEGDDNYIDENIPEEGSVITLNPIEDTEYGEKIIINGTLLTTSDAPIADAPIVININGKDIEVTTNDKGVYFYALKATALGTNNVTVSYAGSDQYAKSETEVTFEVAAADVVITIDDIADVKYSDNVTITGTFTSASGKALSKSNIKLVLNGVTLKLVTDADGVFTYTTKATTMGENTVTVSYEGYGNYNSAENSTTFNVIKQDLIITIDEIPDAGYNETVTITGTFTDANGVALGSSTLTVTINGEKQTTKTAADGTFTLETQSIIAGENNVTVSYGGYAKYNPYQANATFNIVLEDTVITVDAIEDVTYNDTVTITGKLTDANGKAFAKSTVIITLNGKDLKVKTDANGVYTYTFHATTMDLNTVKVAYDGYGKLNPSEAETTFTVNKKDTLVTVEDIVYENNRVNITGKLTDGNGVALTNSKVKVTFNGKVSYVAVDAEGTYVFSGYVADGKINYTVGYGGTKYYNEYTSEPVSLTIV